MIEKKEVCRKIIKNDIVILYADKSIRKIPIPKPPLRVKADADNSLEINHGHIFKEL